MCFISYELALHPDIQEKLIEEIDTTAECCDNGLTYEAVKSMKYLDMVVSETLRKWPITPFVTRVCTKPYTIEPKRPTEQPINLGHNAIIWLPIYGLHRDPKYFPDPDRFDPDRFSDENKS
ncbi:p450 domain containing protein, partial [Asbolus verrucosus]